jgi:hypothetical protein
MLIQNYLEENALFITNIKTNSYKSMYIMYLRIA